MLHRRKIRFNYATSKQVNFRLCYTDYFSKWHLAFRPNNLLPFWKSSFLLTLIADSTIRCSCTASQGIVKQWSAHSNEGICWYFIVHLKDSRNNILNSDTAYTKHSIHNSKIICPQCKFSGYCSWWFCNDSLLSCKTTLVAIELFITVSNGTKKNVNYRPCAAIHISSKPVKLGGSVWFEVSTAK